VSSSTFSSDQLAAAGRGRADVYLAWLVGTAAAAFALMWIYVNVAPMAFLSRDYPLWLAKQRMIDGCAVGLAAVFGDSRAVAGVVPSVMPIPVSNLAMSSTGPIETYFSVRRLLRCARPPRLIVIAHSVKEFGEDANFWNEGALLGFLNYVDLQEVDHEAERLHDSGSLGSKESDGLVSVVRDRLYSLRFPPLYFASLLHGYFAARLWHNESAMAAALSSHGHALFGTEDGSDGVTEEKDLTGFHASPIVDHYFSETLEVARARGVRVIFISMPMNQSTYNHVVPSLEPEFGAYLGRKESEFSNFRLYGHLISCWPDKFFGDKWHFNEQGGEAFSRAFGAWLKDLLAGAPVARFADRCERRATAINS
jgi:hypothetical protein